MPAPIASPAPAVPAAAATPQLRGSGRQGFASRVVIDAQANANEYNYPHRIRPHEPLRKRCIVQNIGSTAASLGYAAQTLTNSNYNAPSFTVTLQPGQEYVEPAGSSAALFARPATSGQGMRLAVYTDLGVQ